MESIIKKAKQVSQEEIDALCSSIDEFLPSPNKSLECCDLMCQLFITIQASEPNYEPCISTNLVRNMIQCLRLATQKSQGGGNRCRLCQMILSELFPMNTVITDFDENTCLPFKCLQLMQCLSTKSLQEISLTAKEWLDSDKFDKQKAALSLVMIFALKHGELRDNEVEDLLEKLAHRLSSSSLIQAPNPYAMNPFRKENESVVTEVDGSSTMNLFTILSIGQYYSEDQILNVLSFSILNTLLCRITQLKTTDDQSLSPSMKKCINIMVDYCLRVFEQSELKVKVQCDSDLQTSCLIECIHILDVLCKLDKDQTARVFQEVKRLNSRLAQETPSSPTLIHILKFIFNHSSSVVYAPQETYRNYFITTIANQYSDEGLMYDTLEFLCNNIEHVAHNTEILTDYFPNLFKILAWHPRIFIKDFMILLPAMMNSETSMELLHLILDLPCMTAALEVMERSKKEEPLSTTNTEPANSLEAFYCAHLRPLFNYMTRCESHQGDTVDRLALLHSVLNDVKGNTRVLVCCQLVPVLLKIWFETMESYGEASLISLVLPVILERSGLLYSVPELVQDVHKIFADKLLKLCKAFPEIIVTQYHEVIDFLQTTANMAGRVQIFVNLIYAVGEYGSLVYSSDCTADRIGQFYECLEIVTYELVGQLSLTEFDPSIAKVLSALMSALTKLACRSHDLIPRAILCLTKVTKQQNLILLNSSTKEYLTQRATSLISLMKLPDTASTLVASNPHKCHLDTMSQWSVLRGLHRLLKE
ncbi:AP-5 complex subunit zeta-1-like [Biomphalaria glabrata]|uniref:AP-5 complex subunit zeta-1-like n=1 Tax=Biomphalaria glabrata TaxID=6526 RepID=A0A9W2ZKZ6_BIOGL|nr:AP-5 complex subunit zeta-1-like [Biomphalaria glabrata]